MKKIFKFLAVFFLAFTIVGCSSNTVTPSTIQDKIDAKDTFIVVVSSSTCSYCKQYQPIVEEFVKNTDGVDLQEIVIDKLEDQDAKTEFLNKYSITGTPTTLFFKDGVLVTMVAQVLSEDKLSSLYDEYLK